jgi:gamma-glutamyltranspeptidase
MDAHGVGLATPLRDATEAGLSAAGTGGNAIDAALTAAAVLTVAYPHNCALGGDLLALVREPDGTKTVINASGRAPVAIDVDAIRREHDDMPLAGPNTVTVPGLVSGWAALHAKGASRSWSQTLQPAVKAAADGVVVSEGLARSLAEDWTALSASDGIRATFSLLGNPMRAGEMLRQPALAQTLCTLASEGPNALYEGVLGDRLVAGLRRLGSRISLDDLQAHRVSQEVPLSLFARGWTVDVAPPNSQGFVLLRLLGMLELGSDRERSLSDSVSANAVGRAFFETADERDRWLADPAAMTVDVHDLLRRDSLADLLSTVTGSSTEEASARTSSTPNGDTVAIAAADTSGRSVSLIQSLYYSFGSQILEPETGIIMHNRGACFSLDPNSPNVIAPGKRPAHTLLPTLAEKGDERLALGTMGGESQPQILLQVLSKLFAGQSCQEAVSAPRWTVGAWDRGEPRHTLSFERDIPADLRDQLSDWDGPVKELPSRSSQVGHTQVVQVSGARVSSGTDPRADGSPL